MISIPVGPRNQQIALAALPSYLNRHGVPLDAVALRKHFAIRYRLPGGPLFRWNLQHRSEIIQVEPISRLVLSVKALNTGLSYARAGMGIIGTFRNWLKDDFQRETLVPVLPDLWFEQEGPRLYYPSRFTSTPFRAFIEICRKRNMSCS